MAVCEIGDQVVALGRQSTSVMHRLVKLCASFEQSREWAFAGMPTAAHWISLNTDVELSTAREWIRIGKALEHLPKCDEALACQLLSFSKIRTLTRVAKTENESD